MAAGPYGKKNEVKTIIWSDAKLHPDRPKVKESLRTKKIDEAWRRKGRLEDLRDKGKHDPWRQKWYENETIKPFVTGSLLEGDIRTIRKNTTCISIETAAQQYIDHQLNRPVGWTTERSRKVYPNAIKSYVNLLGPELSVTTISEEKIYKILHRKNPITGKPISSETIKSDRIKNMGMNRYWIKRGWISYMPEVEIMAPQEKVPKFMHPDQLRSVCIYKELETQQGIDERKIRADQHQLRFILAWQIMAGTGMRPSEAAKVGLNDVYGDHLLVGSTGRTKTGPQRMVPLLYGAKQAVELLTDPEYRNGDRQLRNSDRLMGIALSTMRKVSEEYTRIWKILYADNGNRTNYNLRDSFAVRFLSDSEQGNQDFRLLQLRNILGHASMTTTEKYLKAVPYRLDLTPDPNLDWDRRRAELLNIVRRKKGEVTV